MTKTEIIASLLDQARDKDALANGEADSIFADDARALREAAELLKSVPGWVSVDKALPAEGMHVIGFDIESRWDYPSLYFRPDTKEFLDEMYDNKPVKITHWMPCPESPKEEEKDE